MFPVSLGMVFEGKYIFVFNLKCYIFHLFYRDVKKLLDERFDPEHMDETKKEKYRAFEVA